MKIKKTYTVIVGNVGNMDYTSKKLAIDCFTTYKTLSINKQTRAAGESVTLLEGDTILMEHIGEVDLQEDD